MLRQAGGLHLYLAPHDLHFPSSDTHTAPCLCIFVYVGWFVSFCTTQSLRQSAGLHAKIHKNLFQDMFSYKIPTPFFTSRLALQLSRRQYSSKACQIEMYRKAISPILSSSNFQDNESIISANGWHV